MSVEEEMSEEQMGSEIEEGHEIKHEQQPKKLRARKKGEIKKKKITKKVDQKKPIDGKQQFGDKAICRLCRQTTQQTTTIICNRCHFKYHPECIAAQEKEPNFVQGHKWQCASCIVRVQKKKHKELDLKPKKNIPDFFKNIKPLQEDKAKKLLEFQQQYPTYVQQGRVIFPILDEYLTAYQGLFGVDLKKKQAPREDPDVPQDVFEDVLIIWDSYNNMQRIVSDILCLSEVYNQSNLSNIGTLQHFKESQQLYNEKTRKQIYTDIQENSSSLIFFFGLFYVKQIIEDIDAEQMQKVQYKTPYWHLMGYLWLTNRTKYYQLLHHDINNLPLQLFRQGLLRIDQYLLDGLDNPNPNPQIVRKVLIQMIDGLSELKRTQFMLQFRTENLLSNNRMKVQLGVQIKGLRTEITDLTRQVATDDSELASVKTQLQSTELSRVETSKLTRQSESIIRNIAKLKNQIQKHEREQITLAERYQQLEQDLQVTQIPSLLLNPSMFLGYDQKNCQYYFFLYECDKLFVCWKETFIDEDSDMKWGYYSIEDTNQLLLSLCTKGVRECQLKSNIQELQKARLLTQVQSTTNIQDQDEQELVFSQEDLIEEFLSIEASLSNYLNNRQSRWCASDLRVNFRKQIDSIQSLSQAIEHFVENTMMQEKLELRPEEGSEVNDDNNDDSNDAKQDYDQQVNELQNIRKRKVVEDDSEVEEQTYLQQLEQMDQTKVRIRKLPMKLFGTYYENLRLNLIEQVKNSDSMTKIKLALDVLGQIVNDYIDRKRLQQVAPQLFVKKDEQKKPDPVVVDQRIRFTQLRVRSKAKPQYLETESRWEDICKACGQGGKVICCDTCPSVFHAKCLSLKEVPQGKWNCLKCLSNFERQVKTRATIKKLENQ